MPTTLDEIIVFLERQELKFRVLDGQERILTGFGTQRYRDTDGDLHLHLIIALEESGEFFKVFAPSCYRNDNEEHQEAVFQTLLMVSWRSKMVQFELDQHGGSICATVEFPLEDSTLTENQMIRAIYAVVRILEYYHPVIQGAIDSGTVDFSIVEEQDSVMQMMHQILETVGLEDEESDEDSVSDVEEDPEEESEPSSDDLGDFI